MKYLRVGLFVTACLLLFSLPVHSAPNCDKNPGHRHCQGPTDPPSDPPDDGDGQVWEAVLSGPVSGKVWSRPGLQTGDDKYLNFNPNGPNVVGFDVDNAFLVAVFGAAANTCFPNGYASGSMQLADFTTTGKDSSYIGVFRMSGFTRANQAIMYNFRMYDDGLDGWLPAAHGFPPEGIGNIVYRSVSGWEVAPSKNNVHNGCESDGIVHQGDGFIDIAVQEVATNPHY